MPDRARRHATPDGRSQLVAETTTLEQFPGGEVLTIDTADMITARIEAVAAPCRRVHDTVDEEDQTSAEHRRPAEKQ